MDRWMDGHMDGWMDKLLFASYIQQIGIKNAVAFMTTLVKNWKNMTNNLKGWLHAYM